DNDHRTELISQLRALAPESPWLQEALLSAGNMYLIKKDYETASRFYSEIYQRQRNGKLSPYAHWKAAWLTYRLGKKDDAKRLFDEQLDFYPSSAEAPAALYWRARLAETDNDQPLARAYYYKLSEKYRYFYYANLGRERLTRIGLQNVADSPLLSSFRCLPCRRRSGMRRPTIFAPKKPSFLRTPRSMISRSKNSMPRP